MALRLIRARLRGESTDHPYARGESETPPHPGGRSNRPLIMLVLVLGVAAVALLVMERSAGPPVSPLVTPALEGEPDFYMEAPVVSQYREDGTLEYRLVAERASHYQRDAVTRLTEPHLTLFPREGAPWTVSAREGTLHRPAAQEQAQTQTGVPEETVSLDDNVLLERPGTEGAPLRLATPFMRLYPRRQYAETDRDVIIESSFGRTTATGLEGDLQSGALRFYSTDDSPVRTILQPEEFK